MWYSKQNWGRLIPKLSLKKFTFSAIVCGFFLMLWKAWSSARVQLIEGYFDRNNLSVCQPLKATEDDVGAKLFPHQDPASDRILTQLNYVPENYESLQSIGAVKSIALDFKKWRMVPGRRTFRSCPVSTCKIVPYQDYKTADLVAYKELDEVKRSATPQQIVMKYTMESPAYQKWDIDGVNWTASYRPDSDIVSPYEKWVYHDPNVRQLVQSRNYALNKTKKVAMIVSHCPTFNKRLQYAEQLKRHIQVDIYGKCGSLTCPTGNRDECFKLLERDYKFYLAFENSNCDYYITEKLFYNAYNWNVLPIVMGARREDYEAVAPYRSYINVEDFATPKDLAAYLHKIDGNDELYNSYFKWVDTGKFINTRFWCRVCAALHDPTALTQPHCYRNDWWNDACMAPVP